MLRSEARERYPHFSDRLAKVAQKSDGIGWGFHDFIAGEVSQLDQDLGAH